MCEDLTVSYPRDLFEGFSCLDENRRVQKITQGRTDEHTGPIFRENIDRPFAIIGTPIISQ